MTAPVSPDEVAARLESAGLPVSREEAVSLAAYLTVLEQWNRVHNLTGIRDRDRLIDRHLVESLALRPLVVGPSAADVGSGGGLPGIPLAISLPGLAFTLIESRRKRASFLRHVAVTLGLGNVSVAHLRAEHVESGPFSTVLARAVAPPAELLRVTSRLVASGGRIVLLAGEGSGREIAALADGFTEVATGAPAAPVAGRIVVLERAAVS